LDTAEDKKGRAIRALPAGPRSRRIENCTSRGVTTRCWRIVESYGSLFPPDSRFRKPVDEALLRIKENGEYDEIYRKCFGSESRN